MKAKIRTAVWIAPLCILVGIAGRSLFGGATVDVEPNTISVGALKQSLPSDEQKRNEYLAQTFFKQEHKFESYTVRNWKSNFTAFASVLSKKAQDQNLDSASLRSVLDLILKDAADRIAYLPIGAYESKLNGTPVWIVVVMILSIMAFVVHHAPLARFVSDPVSAGH